MVFYALVLQFNFKKLTKEEKKMVLFSEKQKKNKTGHHNDIFRWKRDGFSSENEVTKGIL